MPLRLEDFYWDDFFWKARTTIPSAQGFQCRGGPYGSVDGFGPSTGDTDLVFAPEGRDDSPLSEPELALVNWFLKHEASVFESVIQGISDTYPTLQEQYGYSGDEKTEYMPDIKTKDDLRKLIGLHSVNVHPIDKNSIPYLGFEFGCAWDQEHGLGILTHGTRVVKVGGGDTAILLWLAEEDANSA